MFSGSFSISKSTHLHNLYCKFKVLSHDIKLLWLTVGLAFLKRPLGIALFSSESAGQLCFGLEIDRVSLSEDLLATDNKSKLFLWCNSFKNLSMSCSFLGSLYVESGTGLAGRGLNSLKYYHLQLFNKKIMEMMKNNKQSIIFKVKRN